MKVFAFLIISTCIDIIRAIFNSLYYAPSRNITLPLDYYILLGLAIILQILMTVLFRIYPRCLIKWVCPLWFLLSTLATYIPRGHSYTVVNFTFR